MHVEYAVHLIFEPAFHSASFCLLKTNMLGKEMHVIYICIFTSAVVDVRFQVLTQYRIKDSNEVYGPEPFEMI